MVDPGLDADLSHYCVRLGQGVVDVGPKRMERHPAHHQLFDAGNLRPGDAAFDDDLDTLGPGLHGPLGGLAHGPAVGNPALQLVGHVPGHQIGIGFGLFNLDDIELDPALRYGLEFGTQTLYPLSIPANQNSRAGRVDVDDTILSAAVNLDPGDACIRERFVFVLDAVAQAQVLNHQFTVGGAVSRVPMGLPVLDDAKPEPVWVGLMSHA